MRKSPSLKARALRFLALREHSIKELRKKLSPYLEEGDNLDELIAWLIDQGFLSETRFVESFVKTRQSKYGNQRILRDLSQHQLSEADQQKAYDSLDNEAVRAQAVWEKKFKEMPKDAKERAKQMRFLQQRGFTMQAIYAVMKGDVFED